MNVSVTAWGGIAFNLPRLGECVIVEPHSQGYSVYGVNETRGFSWGVGEFASYIGAIKAAKQHVKDEIELAGCFA